MAQDKYNQSVFLVLKAAYLYYIENKGQGEIAEELKVSVTTVSRLLSRAKEEKIVEFVIRDPYLECINLERKLKERYGLRDVVIAPGITAAQYDVDMAGSTDERMSAAIDNEKKLVALEAARYLQRIVRDNDILGITWGSTVFQMINYLNPSQRTNTKFVTLHGSIACCENELDVRTLVSRMAKAFSGENYYLLTEALMSSPEACSIMKQEKNNRRVFDMYKKINVAVTGIGSFYPEKTSVLAGPDFMSAQDLAELEKAGVAGDIALRFFDKDGNECKTGLSDRMISIDFEDFKKIETRILIAAGAYKACAVASALKGGIVNTLIVDYRLAEELLK